MLLEKDNVFLVEPFFEEATKEALWSCEVNKTLGSDIINLNFVISCQDFVGKDINYWLLENFLPAGASQRQLQHPS